MQEYRVNRERVQWLMRVAAVLILAVTLFLALLGEVDRSFSA
jgi:hypothetical protein